MEDRVCENCGGKLESKGIRRDRRRYRCVACKSNAGSVLLSEIEVKVLKKQDDGIEDLSLAERYEEIRGLAKTKNSYSLLPKYDPKYCNPKSAPKNPAPTITSDKLVPPLGAEGGMERSDPTN